MPSHIVAVAQTEPVLIPEGPLDAKASMGLTAKLRRSELRYRRALKQAVAFRAGKRRR